MKEEALTLRSPDAREGQLLRALLLSGGDAAEAWARWVEPVGDSGWLDHLSPYKRIWPLILRASLRNEIPVPAEVRIALKAAFAAEKIRHIRVWRRLESGVARLSGAGVASVVQGGAALAAAVYPEPGLRHVHAVRLGVSDIERALHELSKEEFLPRGETNPPGDAILLMGPDRQSLSLALDADAGETPPRGAPLALQPTERALSSAWEETLAAKAPRLVWAFDVFFATGLQRPRSAKNDPLLHGAIELLGKILRERPDGRGSRPD
jgi:hypothetical protein